MKPKTVQAQRKYAHGAPVPASTPGTSVERRTGEITVHTGSIFYNNNTAADLLDVIAFGSVHKHMQPIVLVERLDTARPHSKIPAEEQPSTSTSSSTLVNKKDHEQSPTNVPSNGHTCNIRPTKRSRGRPRRRLDELLCTTRSAARTRRVSTEKRHFTRTKSATHANISDDDEVPLKFLQEKILTRASVSKTLSTSPPPAMINGTKGDPKPPKKSMKRKLAMSANSRQKAAKRTVRSTVTRMPQRKQIKKKQKRRPVISLVDEEGMLNIFQEDYESDIPKLTGANENGIPNGSMGQGQMIVIDSETSDDEQVDMKTDTEISDDEQVDMKTDTEISEQQSREMVHQPDVILSIPSALGLRLTRPSTSTATSGNRQRRPTIPARYGMRRRHPAPARPRTSGIQTRPAMPARPSRYGMRTRLTTRAVPTSVPAAVVSGAARAAEPVASTSVPAAVVSGAARAAEPVPSTSGTSRGENDPETVDVKPTLNIIYNISDDEEETPNPPPSHSLPWAEAIEAPTLYPTVEEFADPIKYIEKLMPTVGATFGICKVVPPAVFTPPCVTDDKLKFFVSNQYISRLYSRWGPVMRELAAIRLHLATQKVRFVRCPLLGGLEVNLPKMFHVVKRLGGLASFSEKRKWNKVSDDMNFVRLTNPCKKLDQIYVKYLLPYDTLHTKERHEKIRQAEELWAKMSKVMRDRAANPLHHSKLLLGESDSEEEPEDLTAVRYALGETEDCEVSGRIMNRFTYEKVAKSAVEYLIPPSVVDNPTEIESLYWNKVLMASEHICVNNASIDTVTSSFGFPRNPNNEYSKHPWNLKVITENKANMLRPLGPVVGLTAPTFHMGMLFSTSCWYRDPHGLPWIEYMHSGPDKVWYGIADQHKETFQKAMETLCPLACQNKGIWLPSATAMVPINLLSQNDVPVSRIIQKPGEFVIVFPKAYSTSICTGYTLSENVYFAPRSWLDTMGDVFQEIRESCEPTTFALEKLLIAIAGDGLLSYRLDVLEPVCQVLESLVKEELKYRRKLRARGFRFTSPAAIRVSKREKDPLECEVCRRTLHLSRVRGILGKSTAVCLLHADRILGVVKKGKRKSKKKIPVRPDLTVEYYFTDKALQEIVANLKKKINNLKLSTSNS